MTTIINGSSPSVTFSDGTLQTTAYPTNYTLGYKNRLINGDILIDQRNAGASQTFTAAAALAYSVDRWYGYCTGANVTGQQIAGTYASSQYRYQFTGAASVTAIGFGQRIEAKNCYDLANQTATLSCYIANSLLTTVTWTASYANTADTFGSLASPTVTQIATGTFTVTSTRTQYTANISVPSAATTGIQIVFSVGAQTSGTWVLDTIQLELGSAATAFDFRDVGRELLLCQRYYEKSYNQSVAPGTSSTNTYLGGWVYLGMTTGSVTDVGTTLPFKVTKRTAATATYYSPNTGTAGKAVQCDSSGNQSDSNATNVGTGDSVTTVYATRATSINVQIQVQWTASAEL
jgi:hypothetical protein